MPESTGTRIRRLRCGHGWSQPRLVYAIGQAAHALGSVPASDASLKAMVSRWENGHRIPDEYNKNLLCVALQVAPDALDG